MLSKFSSMQRSSLPLYNLCRNQVLHTCYGETIISQQPWVTFSQSKPELTRAFSSLVYGPGRLNTAHVDKRVLKRDSFEYCSSWTYQSNYLTVKDNNVISKAKFAVHSIKVNALSLEDCKEKTYLPRNICDRLKKLPIKSLCLTSARETDCVLPMFKSLTMCQKREYSIHTCSKQNHERRGIHARCIFTNSTLLNQKSRLHLKLHSLFHTSTSFCDQQHEGVCIREQPPWRIMFFGTDSIAMYTIKELYNNMINSGSLVESLDVVTGKNKREVAAFAEKENLKMHDWPLAIETGKYDVGVLVSFGHLIPDNVIHMFPYGILNMHPSLLPRWRGASPVVHTILNNDGVTGVSVMDIRPKHFDIGPILLQRTCKVPYRCTTPQLTEILGKYGASTMMECLKDLPTLERFEHEQDTAGITYAHKIKYKDANVDWENDTAEQIDCQYRALEDLFPLKTEFDDHVLKLLNVVDPSLLKDIKSNQVKGFKGDIMESEPGTVGYHKPLKCIVVKCKRGLIGFKNVVLKKTLTASDFNNGYILHNEYTKFNSHDNDLNKYIKVKKISMKAKG